MLIICYAKGETQYFYLESMVQKNFVESPCTCYKSHSKSLLVLPLKLILLWVLDIQDRLHRYLHTTPQHFHSYHICRVHCLKVCQLDDYFCLNCHCTTPPQKSTCFQKTLFGWPSFRLWLQTPILLRMATCKIFCVSDWPFEGSPERHSTRHL